MSIPRSQKDSPVLYRLFDADGRLLYVGATGNVSQRLWEHGTRWWFALVAETRYESQPDLEAAHAAEVVAIQEEQPAFNAQHTGRPAGSREHWTANDHKTYRAYQNACRAESGLPPLRHNRSAA